MKQKVDSSTPSFKLFSDFLLFSGVYMAGRENIVINAILTPGVCTAPVSNPGSACVTPTGAGSFATKVFYSIPFPLIQLPFCKTH